MTAYIGNGPYCYANATAMLLSAVGEEIRPSRIEVLSGVGLGAFWLDESKLLFLSNLAGAPDKGVSAALTVLGFRFKERWMGEVGSPPYEALREDLTSSPAVLGPLDMGYLRYNPFCEEASGADHFVLAYALDESHIHLHDPEGFPHVTLPLEALELAWRAENIGYRRGYYRYWASPTRVEHPSEAEIYGQALESFRALYLTSDEVARELGWMIGGKAILALAGHLNQGKVAPDQAAHMGTFVFRLGARRALDYASFFQERNPELNHLKHRQAELLGSCHTLAVQGDWPSLARPLEKLGSVEDDFRAALLAA